MKYLLLLLVSSTCFAKDFHFVYLMPFGKAYQKFEYKTSAGTWEEAYERGAQLCTDFFSKREQLEETRILEIVDVCANPGERKD